VTFGFDLHHLHHSSFYFTPLPTFTSATTSTSASPQLQQRRHPPQQPPQRRLPRRGRVGVGVSVGEVSVLLPLDGEVGEVI
jgi:hypothetical protein